MVTRLAGCLAAALALAGSAAASRPPEKKFGNWTVGAMADGEGAYAATVNDSGGVLGLFCYREAEKCLWLLANEIQCEDESRYPVLVNSDAGAFTTEIVCMKNGNKPRYAFADFDEIEDAVLKADWMGIAYPMASGKFKVGRFSLKGSNEAVSLLRKVMEAAVEKVRGTRDESL